MSRGVTLSEKCHVTRHAIVFVMFFDLRDSAVTRPREHVTPPPFL